MAAGTLLMAAQLHWKARLILSAGAVRPVTLAGVRVGARRAAGTSPSGTGGAAWPGPRVRPPACIRPVGTDRRRA
jgi:hypothetical protein